MQFEDRKSAGKLLAEKLQNLAGTDSVILAIPRGGVVVAFQAAKKLKIPLDVIIPRKLGAPGNPELAVGAVTGDGSVYVNSRVAVMVGADGKFLQREIDKQLKEIREREKLYRGNRPPLEIRGKTVVIIDDGAATGSTMIAAINALRNREPEKIIAAVPVAPPDTIERLEDAADEVVCLYCTDKFFAVGQFYQDFTQTSHEEVVELLESV